MELRCRQREATGPGVRRPHGAASSGLAAPFDGPAATSAAAAAAAAFRRRCVAPQRNAPEVVSGAVVCAAASRRAAGGGGRGRGGAVGHRADAAPRVAVRVEGRGGGRRLLGRAEARGHGWGLGRRGPDPNCFCSRTGSGGRCPSCPGSDACLPDPCRWWRTAARRRRGARGARWADASRTKTKLLEPLPKGLEVVSPRSLLIHRQQLATCRQDLFAMLPALGQHLVPALGHAVDLGGLLVVARVALDTLILEALFVGPYLLLYHILPLSLRLHSLRLRLSDGC
mmetsp:Transcript_132411/g.330196  ORF Transcript_132411/g.330196 Transcript_132411/m.330196 type:complete len:284 (+) Transcript_132411:174-1025(+)